ncbi:hypothetical protein HY771_03980 [Candidatus Uhrbacteria bacterium]|nr:hypothetical protein [Candidatus Uhrbacteria bacterium]
MTFIKPFLFLFVIGSIALFGFHSAPIHAAEKNVTIFFNEACQDCSELVKEMYPEFFAKYDATLTLKDYLNDRNNRKELNQMNEKWGVPFSLQSHIETFIDDRILIGGHVPMDVIAYLLDNPDSYNKILVYQDEMHGNAETYQAWNFIGEVKTYPIDEPITTYLAEQSSQRSSAPKNVQGFFPLFALISTSAFLDGLNPCAFAVLLFFIAFLFTMRKTRRTVWKMGTVYILAIYLAYLLIGVGLAQAFLLTGSPHLMARIGSYLVIALGILHLIGTLFPKFPIHLRIPLDTKATLEHWMYRATLPASFIGGFLVGLCTFPCSGGIYVAIIGMLANQTTATGGFFWMLWYNVMFVAPLIILLLIASNPRVTERMQLLERAESKYVKLIIGGFMVFLGALILIFFT